MGEEFRRFNMVKKGIIVVYAILLLTLILNSFETSVLLSLSELSSETFAYYFFLFEKGILLLSMTILMIIAIKYPLIGKKSRESDAELIGKGIALSIGVMLGLINVIVISIAVLFILVKIYNANYYTIATFIIIAIMISSVILEKAGNFFNRIVTDRARESFGEIYGGILGGLAAVSSLLSLAYAMVNPIGYASLLFGYYLLSQIDKTRESDWKDFVYKLAQMNEVIDRKQIEKVVGRDINAWEGFWLAQLLEKEGFKINSVVLDIRRNEFIDISRMVLNGKYKLISFKICVPGRDDLLIDYLLNSKPVIMKIDDATKILGISQRLIKLVERKVRELFIVADYVLYLPPKKEDIEEFLETLPDWIKNELMAHIRIKMPEITAKNY